MKRFHRELAVTLVLTLAASACGGDDGSSGEPDPVTPRTPLSGEWSLVGYTEVISSVVFFDHTEGIFSFRDDSTASWHAIVSADFYHATYVDTIAFDGRYQQSLDSLELLTETGIVVARLSVSTYSDTVFLRAGVPPHGEKGVGYKLVRR